MPGRRWTRLSGSTLMRRASRAISDNLHVLSSGLEPTTNHICGGIKKRLSRLSPLTSTATSPFQSGRIPTEAALLKLPTGTGKSGVIAVLARCLPAIHKVLILTPRTALTDQLLRDIRYRFWGHLGYEIQYGELFTAEAAAFGAALETVYTETLLPSRCRSMSLHLDDRGTCHSGRHASGAWQHPQVRF